MTFRQKLAAGIVSAAFVAAFLSAVAIAQVPALFVTSLTGTEQINVLVPSTGLVTTNPQTQVVTTKVLAAYVNAQGTGVDAQTGTSYTIVSSDLGKLVTFNNASAVAVTLPQATGAFGVGSTLTLSDIGAGAVTITPTTSTINGSTTFVLNQSRSATLFSDGTNWQVDTGGSGLQVTPATIAEGGTNASTASGARTSLAVPGLATNNTFAGSETFAAGTTTLTPTIDQTGVLNTAAVAGGHEFDGTTFYDAIAASSRGDRVVEQYQYLTGTYTLTSQQAAQQALNGTTNGAIGVLAATAYRFDCNFGLTSMSASSGTFGFAWGLLSSATLTAQYWTADANKGGTSLLTPGAVTSTFNTTANTALTAANTNTTAFAHIYGIVQVNHAGSLQPQLSLGVAAAAVVAAGSGCRLWPIGPAATVSVGNWN
jgi:hypothetical protein